MRNIQHYCAFHYSSPMFDFVIDEVEEEVQSYLWVDNKTLMEITSLEKDKGYRVFEGDSDAE